MDSEHGFGIGSDFLVHGQCFFHFYGKIQQSALQFIQIGTLADVQDFGELHGKGVHGHELGQIRLGRGDADFRSSPGIDDVICIPGNGRTNNVGHGNNPCPFGFGVPEDGKCIGGFPGLADHDDQGRLIHDRIPVAEL